MFELDDNIIDDCYVNGLIEEIIEMATMAVNNPELGEKLLIPMMKQNHKLILESPMNTQLTNMCKKKIHPYLALLLRYLQL